MKYVLNDENSTKKLVCIEIYFIFAFLLMLIT